jgi:uncharacterized protein (TIGR03435 family)
MRKQLLSATSVLALAAGALLAQTPAAAPTFEVVSIKAVDMPGPAQVASGKIHAGMKIDAARVDIGLISLMELICKAYDVKSFQVQGPDWLKSVFGAQRFDIIAKMPEGSNKSQVPQMLQAMLADRFKLVIRKEKKEQSVLALVVAKGGPKLKESAPMEAAPPPEAGGPTAASTGSSQVSVKANAGGTGAVVSDGDGLQQKVSMADGKMHYEITGITMAKFVDTGVTPMVDKPVIDVTDLKGRYDITMDIPMAELMNVARKMGAPVPNSPGGGGADSSRPADAASEPTGSIYGILQSLGLKLEPRKMPIDLIIVEKVEKLPTDN